MNRTLVLVAILALTSPAMADDESSEHTAVLAGDAADTIGVTVTFDAAKGWSMRVRTKPGAKEKTFQLAMPKQHAHYVVYVTPGRRAIAFVEVSAGSDVGREKVRRNDKLAWVWSPTTGKLVRSWTYGQLFAPSALAKVPRSISHLTWYAGHAVTKAGLEMRLDGAKPRSIVLDTKAKTMR